eukprot:GHVP01005088.1.p1 GENE.GHVP01005088.1~~GHVP01005088.1.p1  ORF type:complete len:111 (+),score=1.89 GHVP01005088.1:166-498(+)
MHVTKPNLSIRVTHDYSALKPYTSLYKFNQNKIEDILTWSASRFFLMKLDFIKAFHSVEINENDHSFYGFVGPDLCNYHYLPILQKYPNHIRTYQDDIAISEDNKEETFL